jgi:hypothetical protein
MDPMNFHRLRGNWKTLSAALGVGVLITMGAVTVGCPIGAIGTSSDNWKADTTTTLMPSDVPTKFEPKAGMSLCDFESPHHRVLRGCGFPDEQAPCASSGRASSFIGGGNFKVQIQNDRRSC